MAGGSAEDAREGWLMLDGMPLGRWVTELLAREAGRPAPGVTGVDPRLGGIWPGALHGD